MNKETIKFTAKVLGAEDVPEVAEIARQRGIRVPSTHLAFFKSVYAPIEEANANGVRLARHAVDRSLKGLVGAQVNLEHLRHGFVVGSILDAWINANNEIEIAFTFFKSIYVEEFERALAKLELGELSVSFELTTDPNTKEMLDDGTVRLNDIDFEGVGLLIDNPPAYRKAQVFEFAKKYKQRALDYLNNEKELVCATQVIESCEKVLNQARQTLTTNDNLHMHGAVIDDNGNGHTITIATDPTYGGDANHIHEISNGEVLEAAGHIHSLDEFSLDAKIEENKDINSNSQGGQTNMSDQEKKQEENLENAEEVKESEEVAEPESDETEESKDESPEEATEEKSELEQIQEENTNLKATIAELEATLEAKNSEIDEVRTNAEQIGKLKVELKDNPYVAEFKDEDYLDEAKLEKAKLQKENDDLKKANEELAKDKTEKKEQVEAKEEVSLETGHKEEDSSDYSVPNILNKWYNHK